MLSKISRNSYYPLLLLLLVIGSSNTAPTSTDCNGKDFICPDENTFLICVRDENGESRTVDNTPQNCPTGYYCDNNLENECSASVPPSAAARQGDQTDETVDVEETTQVEETVVIEKEVTETMVEEIPEPATTAPESTEAGPEVSQENSETETETQEETHETVQQDETKNVDEETVEETVNQGEDTETEIESDKTVNEENTDESENTTDQQETSTEGEIVSESTNQEESNTQEDQKIEESGNIENSTEDSDTTDDESNTDETTENSDDVAEETSGDNQEESTPEAPPATVAPLVCNSIGKFGDPNDCRKYALCIWTPFGYRKFENMCVLDQAYDPISKECVDDLTLCDAYNRPTTMTHEFQCTERGRFPDLDNDRKYYACLLDPLTGDFVQISLTCPILTVFNEAAQRCILELFPGEVPSDETNNSNQPGSEIDDHNTSQNENGAGEVIQVEEAAIFVCTEEGTFPDPADESRYFICKLKKKDKFKLKHKKCGKKKIFNPETLLCFDPTLVVDEETHESQESVSTESVEDQKIHQEKSVSE